MTLQLGDRFDTFEEFKAKLEEYCTSTYSKFSICDSKSVAHANQNLPPGVEPYPEKLKYRSVSFCCNYLRNDRATLKRLGVSRNNKRARKELCEAYIGLVVEKQNRNQLTIVKFNEEHSHPLSYSSFLDDTHRKSKTLLKHYPIKSEKKADEEIRKSARIRSPNTKFSNTEESPWVVEVEELNENTEEDQPSNQSVLGDEFLDIIRNTRTPEKSSSVVNYSSNNENGVPSTVNPTGLETALVKALTKLSETAARPGLSADPDDLFFSSVSAEIKHLPREIKSDLKLRILAMVNETLHEHPS